MLNSNASLYQCGGDAAGLAVNVKTVFNQNIKHLNKSSHSEIKKCYNNTSATITLHLEQCNGTVGVDHIDDRRQTALNQPSQEAVNKEKFLKSRSDRSELVQLDNKKLLAKLNLEGCCEARSNKRDGKSSIICRALSKCWSSCCDKITSSCCYPKGHPKSNEPLIRK